MIPDPPAQRRPTGSTRPADEIRRIDRELRVARTTALVVKWTTLPALGTLGLFLLQRIIEIGALLDIRTIGTALTMTIGYGILRSYRRQLLKEIADLEHARAVPAADDAMRDAADDNSPSPGAA